MSSINSDTNAKPFMDFENLKCEIVEAKVIGGLGRIREHSRISQTFYMVGIEIFEDCVKVEGLPYDLDIGELYKITSWNSNHCVRSVGKDKFEILEQFGPDLEVGSKPYLIIEPSY